MSLNAFWIHRFKFVYDSILSLEKFYFQSHSETCRISRLNFNLTRYTATYRTLANAKKIYRVGFGRTSPILIKHIHGDEETDKIKRKSRECIFSLVVCVWPETVALAHSNGFTPSSLPQPQLRICASDILCLPRSLLHQQNYFALSWKFNRQLFRNFFAKVVLHIILIYTYHATKYWLLLHSLTLFAHCI